MKKTIYRTVVSLVVLSEEEIPETMSLQDILNECDYGNYVGAGISMKNSQLIGKTAVIEIEKSGSDPEFFQMDSEGNSLDEDITDIFSSLEFEEN